MPQNILLHSGMIAPDVLVKTQAGIRPLCNKILRTLGFLMHKIADVVFKFIFSFYIFEVFCSLGFLIFCIRLHAGPRSREWLDTWKFRIGSKGQLISKKNCRAVTSPKNERNVLRIEMHFFRILSWAHFVCVLGEVTAQQFCLEIYWPLGVHGGNIK